MRKKIFGITFLLIILLPIAYLLALPDTTMLQTGNLPISAIRSFREQSLRKKGLKPRSSMYWKNLDQISPHLVHAVLLAEDDGFYQHHGFDFEQLKIAVQTNWKLKRYAFGASTLTQQLARTLYLSSHKNLLRKAKEALITWKLEKTLSKKRILELYLNNVEWGSQVYGAEAAAKFYFKKSALELTPEEAISLAAILPSPRRWDPHRQNGFMGRRKAILHNRMISAGYVRPTLSTATAESPIVEQEQLPEEEEEPISDDLPASDSKL